MKAWEVLLIGGAVLFGVVLLMKAMQPKATPVNSSFGTPTGSLLGLATTALPGIVNAFKPSGQYYPNAGTYQTGIVPVEVGNTLQDPNTGSTLVYGTD